MKTEKKQKNAKWGILPRLAASFTLLALGLQSKQARSSIKNFKKSLPPYTHHDGDILAEKTPTRDGTGLMTRVYLPKEGTKWPVVISRSPYYKKGNGDVVNSLAYRYLVRYGIAVVCQECRGKGESEGEWEPFVHERDDGLDLLDWVRKQPWCDGRIGLWGGSYTAFLDWVIADALPDEVKTMFLSVMGTEMHQLTYMNGMFRPAIWTLWATENSNVKLHGRLSVIKDKMLRVMPAFENDEKILGKILPWYREMMSNPSPEKSYWKSGLWKFLQDMPSKVNVPVCIVDGWFDLGLQGMNTAFWGLRPEIREKSAFICGPWDHPTLTATDFDSPDDKNFSFMSISGAIEWFNHQFNGMNLRYDLGKFTGYMVRENKWRTFPSWPWHNGTVKLFPSVSEEQDFRGGKLLTQTPVIPGKLSYTYHPDHPVATCGGNALLLPQAGSRLQPREGFRDDVLTFLSDALNEDVIVAGNVRVSLSIASDCEDTCFSAKLMEVFPDGNSYNICDGITTLSLRNNGSAEAYEPGKKEAISIDMWPIMWKLAKGSRVRLDISSSNFPAYHIHSNTAGPWAEQTKTKPAVQTLYTGPDSVCFVELPVIKQ